MASRRKRRPKDYALKGSCNRCGACCRFDMLTNSLTRKSWKLLSRAFGMDKQTLKRRLGEGKCPEYINGECSIYEDRPSFCREFPETPADIAGLSGCGFIFEEALNGK